MDVSDETSKLVWDKEELLGKGCQGTVVYGGHFGNTPVAVKRILIANEDLIQRELNALKECRHPRIVQLYDVTYEEQFLYKESITYLICNV